MNFSNLKKDKMETGNLSLLIPCQVSASSFPKKAQMFKERANAHVLFKINANPEPMWLVLIKWKPFILVLDERNGGMALESIFKWCNPVVEELLATV